jgi:hypothetical protein
LPQRAENSKTLSKKKMRSLRTQMIFWRLARVGTPLLTGYSSFVHRKKFANKGGRTTYRVPGGSAANLPSLTPPSSKNSGRI